MIKNRAEIAQAYFEQNGLSLAKDLEKGWPDKENNGLASLLRLGRLSGNDTMALGGRDRIVERMAGIQAVIQATQTDYPALAAAVEALIPQANAAALEAIRMVVSGITASGRQGVSDVLDAVAAGGFASKHSRNEVIDTTAVTTENDEYQVAPGLEINFDGGQTSVVPGVVSVSVVPRAAIAPGGGQGHQLNSRYQDFDSPPQSYHVFATADRVGVHASGGDHVIAVAGPGEIRFETPAVSFQGPTLTIKGG